MKDLFRALEKDPGYLRLVQALAARRGPVNVTGPADPQKAFLCAALAAGTGLRPVLVVSDELRARAAAEDLRAFTDRDVLVFRPRELGLAEAEASSHETERSRIGILDRLLAEAPDYGAIVITAAAALQKLPPVREFAAARLTLQPGDTSDPGDVASRLVELGYERVRLVEGPGQFALRGDVLDVAPVGRPGCDGPEGRAVRVRFEDDAIDQIKEFEISGQRSVEMLRSLSIPPAHEVLSPEKVLGLESAREALRAPEDGAVATAVVHSLSDRVLEEGRRSSAAAAASGADPAVVDAMRRLARRDADRIEGGALFSGLDRWIPLLWDEPASVLDYAAAGGATLFVDEPLRVRQRMDAAQADFAERVKALLEKGHLLPLSGNVAFRGADLMIRIDRIGVTGRTVSLCSIGSSGNGLPGGTEVAIPGRASDHFRGQVDKLSALAKDRSARGLDTWIFAGSPTRAQRLTEEMGAAGAGADKVTVLPRTLTLGFEAPGAGLLAIGGHDVFGADRPRRRRRHAGMKIDLFSDLSPGDLVVHEAHGIGRYEGLTSLEASGAKRDYLKIAYGGEDTLFIPMDALDQIQKYVGAEGRVPKLSKLGGKEWEKLKDRARESVKKLAADLVKLYAERAAVKGHVFSADTVWQREFEENFPFEETEDQLRSIEEIKRDMESDKVMDRILCGDVGFGKTEVAFRAIFKCLADGKQAAMLSPTTVLAQQHYENLIRRMEGFPVKVGLMSRFATDAQQKEALRGVRSGSVDVLVGTHRLLSKDVVFKGLGLLVVDEEQRFGVDHKEALKVIHPEVDVLTLTATPIPRTLHMSLSGIRDISVLEEPPHDRMPVQTYVMEYDLGVVTEAMLREITRRGQVFYLFNDTRRISEKAAEIGRLLPGARIVYAHGKMGERELEDVISAFTRDEYDVLVCTTIIESGIDMPNVNTIVVEDADRLGLAQLYQLRGRVGRSDRQAYAYVTYRRDKVLTETSEKRLSAIRDFTELGAGFKIALRDLEVRGAGNLLGAEQHGHLDAVGYDLYCRMLEEAILEEKGQTRATTVQAAVDLALDAYLPAAYVPDEGQRMDMYRRIATIDTAADRVDVLDELEDRYGDLPAQTGTLADIAYIRAAAGRLGFSRVSQNAGGVVLAFAEGRKPDMGIIGRAMNLPAYKGRLLFNAGTKPYLLFRGAAADKEKATETVRGLIEALE